MKSERISVYWGAQLEYKQGLLHELINKGIIDFALTDYYPYEGEKKPEENERIITLDHRPCVDGDYDNICDLEELPALDKELLEKMLPFESMAIHICAREPYPIGDYYIAKKIYYNHLRYWNYVFDKYSINFCYFNDVPHVGGKYVAYALAKVKKIPTLMLATAPPFIGRYVYGSDIETIGKAIEERYKEIKTQEISFKLDERYSSYIELFSKGIDNIKKTNNPGQDKNTKREQRYKKKMLLGEMSGLKLYLKTPKSKIHLILKELRGEFSVNRKIENMLLAYKVDSIIGFKRHLAMTLEKYNRIAEKADFSKKYIYFALQLTPEASTLPRAGVFAEQYNSIRLLAKCAEKNGLLVYVKEHYVQPLRSALFYEELRRIKNVRLIKTTESTYDIINNSVGVATQTGSCIMEGTLFKKPVYVFSSGYVWKGLPGVFEIESELQGERIIRETCNNYNGIAKKDLEKYLFAFQQCTVGGPSVFYLREYIQGKKQLDNEGFEEKLSLLSKYIIEMAESAI